MSDMNESTKIISDYESIKTVIKKLGSETKLSDLGFVCFLFVLACIALFIGLGTCVIQLFPCVNAYSDIIALIKIVSFCCSGIILMVSILVSECDTYETKRNENNERRELQIEYFLLKYFDERKIIEASEVLKIEKDGFDEMIAGLKNPALTDLGDINYLIKKFSSEIKSLEKKKKAGWIFSLALTILTTGLDVVENIVKALIWSEYTDLLEYQVDAIASGTALVFFLFLIYLLLNTKSNSISGIVINCRNLEYTNRVLNEFKDRLEAKEKVDTTKFYTEIIDALKTISTSISSTVGIYYTENRELLQTQTTALMKVESVLNQIRTDTNNLSSETKRQANIKQSRIRVRSNRKYTTI